MIKMRSLACLLSLCLAASVSAQEHRFDSRKPEHREKLLQALGGTEASEQAVANGLLWLSRQQVAETGVWPLDGKFPDRGNKNDTAGTALALLPFLGAGYTHQADKKNPHDKRIAKGLDALLQVQNKGTFNRDVYANALAALAVIEAYGMTSDAKLKQPAQLAVDAIASTQHFGGGWRYSPGQAGDTSVTAWQVQALLAARRADLNVDPRTLKKANLYLDSVCDAGKTEGYGYLDPGNITPTMTAAALFSRKGLVGWTGPQNLRFLMAYDNFIKKNDPGLKKDVYYYYYANHVARTHGGKVWDEWNTKMRTQLIKSQSADKTNPETFGSWSPAGDQWGGPGGRLMVTSLNLLILEDYYRHPVHLRD